MSSLLLPSNIVHKAYLFCFAKYVERKIRHRNSNNDIIEDWLKLIVKMKSSDIRKIAHQTKKFCLEASMLPPSNDINLFLYQKCNGPWRRLVVDVLLEKFKSFPDDWEDIHFFVCMMDECPMKDKEQVNMTC